MRHPGGAAREARRRTVAVVIALAAGGLALGTARASGAFETEIAPAAGDSAIARAARRDREVAFYDRRLREDPASALDLAQLAGVHLQRSRESGSHEDVLRAEDAARRSLSLRASRNGRTYVTLASSLMAQHRFAEALAVARDVVAMEPDVAAYRALLGEVQLELGDYAGADSTFAALRGEARALSVAPRLARWAELHGRTGEARRIIVLALAEASRRRDLPAEQVAWLELRRGELELRDGNLDGADAAFRRGLRTRPEDRRLLVAMAGLELLRGRPARAIALGERAEGAALDPATLGVLGDAWTMRGDGARAAEYLRAMEVVALGQPGALHRASGLWLLDHGRGADAVLARAETALRTRHDVYGYDLYAWALHAKGLHAQARMASRRALALGTRDATLHYHAGMIALAAGDSAEALRGLSAALAINPRFHAAHAPRARATLAAIERAARDSR